MEEMAAAIALARQVAWLVQSARQTQMHQRVKQQQHRRLQMQWTRDRKPSVHAPTPTLALRLRHRRRALRSHLPALDLMVRLCLLPLRHRLLPAVIRLPP
jgi:hypothetical protein